MGRGRWLFVMAATSVLVGPVAANAEVIHVAPQGHDRHDGSIVAPVRNLERALAIAREGDIVRLAPGTYRGGALTRCAGVTIEGPSAAVLRGPKSDRAFEVRHDRTVLRGFTIEQADIGVWLEGVSGCVLEGLTLHDLDGEAVRIKNQSRDNVVRHCRFARLGRTGFDVARGRKNGEGVYIGTAPEQRGRNRPPDVPDRCTGNLIEHCEFQTEAAEAVDIKEDSEGNLVRDCVGRRSLDPDGPIFGARGDGNRFERCVAEDGLGHGFRFGGDTVERGEHGQLERRAYGKNNVMRDCVAKGNAGWGAAVMVKPQDIDGSNRFEANGRGPVRP